MKIALHQGSAAGMFHWMDPVEAARLDLPPEGDVVEFSQEALRRLEEDRQQPLMASAMSLEAIESRINTVRSEISSIWNSALPDEEKYRQIYSKENEISLLQAGQFAFARAGFLKVA
ncbi:MAG: hypothetical protein KKB70_04700 [Proteobacteria bacterium]|nr:hypothetical protein [Pseudomonadota bacterium]MBU1611576.1 hypothetical protein [Pseudomonadota bacterium]